MIDIGAYANLRKLEGRFTEIDITSTDARERCRNAPIMTREMLSKEYTSAPAAPEAALKEANADEIGRASSES